jgi:hypothetical protein
MAGNESTVVDYLIQLKNSISINHLGVINRIQNPSSNGQLIDITSTNLLRTESSDKKADIFLNGKGVSIKQSGSTFLYNRLQRADMFDIFTSLGLSNPSHALLKMDNLIQNFHNGQFLTRDRHWSEGFNEADFTKLLEYLMMKGSPNLGISQFPADYILTAPKKNITSNSISCNTYSEYFAKHKNNIYLSLRRQWVGQLSKSEHSRAMGLANKQGNAPWVFNEISGSPRTGWRAAADFLIADRRTVYMIYLTVKP